MSASTATEPLIGIADEGHFDAEQVNSNPGFCNYLECASDYVGNSMNNTEYLLPLGPIGPTLPNTPPDSIMPYYPYTLVASKVPYVVLKWGQRSPYGDRFENGNCGCMTSVLAMIALTAHWPIDLDPWGVTRTHISNGDGCTEDSIEVHPRIAILMKTVSRAFHYEYFAEETVFWFDEQEDHLSFPTAYGECFLVEHYEDLERVTWHLDQYEVDPGYIFVFATTTNNMATRSNQIEHCWLIDGYKTVQHLTPINTERRSETYLHCNWACDGDGNGFYLPTSNFQTALDYTNSQYSQPYTINNTVTYHLVRKDVLVGSNKRERLSE